MKLDKNLIILGAIAAGAYLLYKSGILGQLGSAFGGSGGAYGDGGSYGGNNYGGNNAGTGGNGTGGAGATTIKQSTGSYVTVQRTGSFQHTYITPVNSRVSALITTGTPQQQIQEYNVAPRLITVGGKVRKVM